MLREAREERAKGYSHLDGMTIQTGNIRSASNSRNSSATVGNSPRRDQEGITTATDNTKTLPASKSTYLIPLTSPVNKNALADVPVRNFNSRHMQCFDLNGCLESVISRPTAEPGVVRAETNMAALQNGMPNNVSGGQFVMPNGNVKCIALSLVDDIWKCPICGGDARPDVLAVDGLMADVGRMLEEKGMADAVAVKIDEDGTIEGVRAGAAW